MAQPDKCCVEECDRNAAASVARDDLPGPLRLCATHTEQFRQSSDAWVIDWAKGAAAPSSVSAPGSENLWAYKRPERTDMAPPVGARTGTGNGAKTPVPAMGPLARVKRAAQAISERLGARGKSNK